MRIGRRKKSIRILDENVAVIKLLDETDEFFGYCMEKYVKEMKENDAEIGNI